MIGREGALSDLDAWFARGARLITITGPPGVGKSRLALRHAWATATSEAHPGGVSWLSLGGADPGAALAVLGRSAPGAARRLVLDDADDQLEALRPAVAALLRAQGADTVLVTSREPLGLAGERCLRLEGLGAAPSERGAGDDPAVAFLRERARAFGFDLASGGPPGDDRVLAELVARLDRNPLALEHAARRLVVMSPRRLLSRLDDRLALLRPPNAARSEHAPPSVAEAFERSWRRLTPGERGALAQLAVFAGPVDLDAVEAVVVVGGDRALPDLVDALVRRSLATVGVGPGGGRRLDLGANLRAFARVRLEEDPGALGAVVDRHARLCVARAARLAEHAPSGSGARSEVDAELEAALGVLDWALRPALADPPRLARAAEVLLSLREPLKRRGPLTRAASALDALLARHELLAPRVAARLEVALGELLYLVGRGDEAARRLRAALGRARDGGDPLAEALLVRALGASFVYGRADVATAELAAARATLASDHQDADATTALMCLARAAEEAGETDEALALHRRAVDAARGQGSGRQQAIVELNLGALLAHLERNDDAKPLYRSALARSRELDDGVLEAVLLLNIGLAAFAGRDDEEAGARFARAATAARAADYPRVEAVAELHLGLLALIGGAPRDADQRLAAAREVAERAWPSALDQALLALAEAIVAASLGRPRQAQRGVDRALLAAEGAPGPAGPAMVALAELGVAEAATGLSRVQDAARALVEPALVALGGRPRAGVPQLRAALRLFEGAKRAADAVPGTLLVAPDGRHFVSPAGRRVALGRRGPARRVLAALAEAASRGSGESLSAQALFELGWPGVRLSEPYRTNRVYGVVADLRKLGLGDALVNDGDGYRLVGAIGPLEA